MCFDTEKRDEIEHSAEIRSDVRPSYINAKFLSLAISLHNLIQCQKYLQDLFWAFHNKVFLKFKRTHCFHREERILNEPCFWKLDGLGTCWNFFSESEKQFSVIFKRPGGEKKIQPPKMVQMIKEGASHKQNPAPASRQDMVEPPPENIRDKIKFSINNLSRTWVDFQKLLVWIIWFLVWTRST